MHTLEGFVMTKLKFKVAPKPVELFSVGDEETGILEVPKYGRLSEKENKFIKEESADLPDFQEEAVKLAKKISEESELSLQEVYQALLSGELTLIQDHLEAVIDFQLRTGSMVSQLNIIRATAIIKQRIDAEWTIDDTCDAKQIHPRRVEAIADFALKEQNGWDEDTEDAVEVAKEVLGVKEKKSPQE